MSGRPTDNGLQREIVQTPGRITDLQAQLVEQQAARAAAEAEAAELRACNKISPSKGSSPNSGGWEANLRPPDIRLDTGRKDRIWDIEVAKPRQTPLGVASAVECDAA